MFCTDNTISGVLHSLNYHLPVLTIPSFLKVFLFYSPHIVCWSCPGSEARPLSVSWSCLVHHARLLLGLTVMPDGRRQSKNKHRSGWHSASRHKAQNYTNAEQNGTKWDKRYKIEPNNIHSPIKHIICTAMTLHTSKCV